MGRFVPDSGKGKWWFTFAIRIVQLVIAFVVLGLFVYEVLQTQSKHKPVRNEYWFGIGVPSLGAFAILLTFVLRWNQKSHYIGVVQSNLVARWVLEVLLIVLWAALGGVFGKMYIGTHPANEAESKIDRMRLAVYLVFGEIGALFVSLGWNILRWLEERKSDWEDGKTMKY